MLDIKIKTKKPKKNAANVFVCDTVRVTWSLEYLKTSKNQNSNVCHWNL